MIIRIVKLTIHPDKVGEFKEHFFRVESAIRSFEGCRHLELLSDIDKAGVVFTYSQWDSKSYLEAYLQSELLKSTWKLVKPLFSEKAEAWSVEETTSSK